MGFTKITDADLIDKGVIGLPDQPGLSTAAMQNKLEETARGVIIPKHNGLIDELHDTTAAGNVGAVAPTGFVGTTVQSLIDELASGAGSAVKDAYKNIESGGTTFSASGEDTFKINAGSNVTITPLASPDKGIQISAAGGGSSTGDMLMADYDNDGSVKSASSTGNGIKDYVASAISGKADSSSLATVATSGAYSDLSGKPSLATVATSGSYDDLSNKPTIPDELSDLTDDSTHRLVTDTEKTSWNGKSTVSWNQQVTTGQQIATVTIDGTSVNVFAPTGGGGGGGNVDSVNGKQGTVVLDLGDMDDVTFTGVAQNDAVVRNGSNKWVNVPLPAVALSGSYGDLTGKPSLATVATSGSYNDLSNKPTFATVATSGSYNDLSNKPTIPTVTDTYDGTSSNGMSGKAVKSAIDALDVSDSAVVGQYVSSVSESNGKITVTRAAIPSGGHTMIPIYDSQSGLTDIEAIAALNNGNDNYVVNAYSAKRWSNCDAKIILTTADKDDDGVGTWEDDSTWETGSRSGWLWSADFYRILEDGSGNRVIDTEIIPVFDVGDSETVGLLSYRIDDNVSNGGVNGGAVAFKFTGAIKSAGGVKVGLKLVHQRTEYNDTGITLT